MPSRLQSLISRGAFVMAVLVSLVACAAGYDSEAVATPPPVGIGPGKKPGGSAGSSVPAGMITSGTSITGTTGMMMAMAANDADSGSPTADAAVRDADDADAGPRTAAGGAAAAGGGGRSAAGGAGGSGGSGGRGGAGGSGGGAAPALCQNVFCITVIDCWLLNDSGCNFTDCADFVCQGAAD